MGIGVKYIISYLMVLIAVLAFLSCSAPMSKQYDVSELSDEAMYDSIVIPEEKSFELENDSLTEDNLNVFKLRALQKLEDFADYLELLSDTSVDKTFKDQAQEMALKLFSSEKCKISIAINSHADILPESINEFVQTVRQDKYGMFRIVLGKISEGKDINKTDDITYKGFFVFSASIIKETIYITQWLVNFEIRRIKKDFGGEKKEIWEVYLGDIELY